MNTTFDTIFMERTGVRYKDYYILTNDDSVIFYGRDTSEIYFVAK